MKGLLVLILLGMVCFTLPAESIRIAVTQIEPIGVKKEIARSVEELVQTDFSKNSMFQLVERSQLNELLKEQKLQLSGITSAKNAIEAGKILGVEKVIFGTISNYDSMYIKYLLSLRLVDVEKGSIEAAETIQIRTSDGIVKAAMEITARLGSQIKVEGKVARIANDKVYITLGTASGVHPNMIVGVTERKLIKDDKGQVIMHEDIPIANLVVETVSSEGSRCSILEKGMQVKTGFAVQKGKIEIVIDKEKALLKVRSVPGNAKVYLNSNFTGVTPLTLSDLEPGQYMVEVRSGAGYKPYKGRVTLKAGSSVTLERELKPEVQIEDLLLMGKVPRRQTDPMTAFKKALIPGLGMYYNGYKLAAPIVGISSVTFTSMGVLLVAWNGTPSSNSSIQWDNLGQQVASGNANYSDYRKYYRGKPTLTDDLLSSSELFLEGLFVYGTSLIDSARTAHDNFTYPSYVEFSVMATDLITKQVQTPETFTANYDPVFMDAITKGAVCNTYGLNILISIEARKYLFWLGTGFTLRASPIDVGCQYRFLTWDRFMLGIGFESEGSTQGIGHDYWNGDIKTTNAMITMMAAPYLSFSYRGTKFEADIFASAFSKVMIDTLYVERGSNVFTDFSSTDKPMLGPIVKLNTSYFFNMKTGIRFEFKGAYLKNLDRRIIDKGFTDIDTVQFINASLGMVYRF